MAFSVESRTPYLDHRLVELCFSLPYWEKISDGWSKSVQRRALRDLLPREILDRPKLGYPAPVDRWLKRPDTWLAVRELLLDRRCLDRGIFDRARLERLLGHFASGWPASKVAPVGRVWRWITLELWFRDFIDRPPAMT
jgi:asparagine synthase (glutamine-hydrolysing)